MGAGCKTMTLICHPVDLEAAELLVRDHMSKKKVRAPNRECIIPPPVEQQPLPDTQAHHEVEEPVPIKPRRYVPPPCPVCGSDQFVYVNGTDTENTERELIKIRHIRCRKCATGPDVRATFTVYETIKHVNSTTVESAN